MERLPRVRIRSVVLGLATLAGSAILALLPMGSGVASAQQAIPLNGSSCYNYTCESVAGSGLLVNSSTTYWDQTICSNYWLAEETAYINNNSNDGKLYWVDTGNVYSPGCTVHPGHTWGPYNFPYNVDLYGQTYAHGQAYGIATVYIHS